MRHCDYSDNEYIVRKRIITMEKNKIYLCVSSILFALLLTAGSVVFTAETAWGQIKGGPNMIGPNMISQGKTGFDGGPKFVKGENITGSIDFMSAITKAIASQMKTSLSDASSAAEKSIGNNSHSVAAYVSDENGYLVYVVAVVDSNGKVHKLIVDPADGKILLSRELSGFEALTMLHQGVRGGGHGSPMRSYDPYDER